MNTVALVAVFVGLVMLAYRVWRLENVILNVHDTVVELTPTPDDETAVLPPLDTVTLGELFDQHTAPDLGLLIRYDPDIVGNVG